MDGQGQSWTEGVTATVCFGPGGLCVAGFTALL